MGVGRSVPPIRTSDPSLSPTTCLFRRMLHDIPLSDVMLRLQEWIADGKLVELMNI